MDLLPIVCYFLGIAFFVWVLLLGCSPHYDCMIPCNLYSSFMNIKKLLKKFLKKKKKKKKMKLMCPKIHIIFSQ
jgi:hypothetical protein